MFIAFETYKVPITTMLIPVLISVFLATTVRCQNCYSSDSENYAELTNTTEYRLPNTERVAFIAAIFSLDREFICAGAQVNKFWIVTAASCIYGRTGPLLISLGSVTNILEPITPNQRVHKSLEYITHPLYREGSFTNNIALVKVLLPIKKSPYMRPAIVGGPGQIVPTPNAQVQFTGYYENQLYMGYAYTIASAVCAEDWTNNRIGEDTFCTDFIDPATLFACKDDEIGTGLLIPLPVGKSNSRLPPPCAIKLAAVLVHGGCGKEPSVWVRLESHLEWMNPIIKQEW